MSDAQLLRRVVWPAHVQVAKELFGLVALSLHLVEDAPKIFGHADSVAHLVDHFVIIKPFAHRFCAHVLGSYFFIFGILLAFGLSAIALGTGG